jgi:aminoglycoside phosphotransferase (APT) family kinase protein
LSKKENNQKQDFKHGAQVKMHEGEIDIDTLLVKQLLTEQFPHLANKLLTVVRSTGTVNAIYRLGDDLYVRLPRLEEWAESIDNEWTWLPKLAPHISLTIPKPIVRGKPTNWYPCPWAIYHWIKGSLYQDDLIRDERQVAYDLVNFILELRSIDSLGAPRGGRRPLVELDAETRSAIESSRGVIDTEAVPEAWARSLESTPWDGKPVWIHGDLLKSNLLVQGGRLCAVLDFGGVGIGDPAADVVPAWSVFNKIGRETFRQALDVDDDTWSRARGYALHQALMIIPYYPKTNPEFVTMAKRTVEEILTELK